jgi:hypothetical protein
MAHRAEIVIRVHADAGWDMKKTYRFLVRIGLPVFLIILVFGCSTVHKSRIYLNTWGKAPDGMVVANFSVDEVDSFVRTFAIQKGYEIKFADSSNALTQEETGDDESSLLWIAEKPGEPAILFISTGKELIVTLIQTSGLSRSAYLKEYTNVIYRMLEDKFGEENVRMVF